MKLLRRVVKSSLVSGNSEPVFIDNTIVIPVKKVIEENLTEEQKQQLEIKRQKEAQEKEISDRVQSEIDKFKNRIESEKADYIAETQRMREKILSDAKSEAEKLIENSKSDIEKATEKAKKEGFEAGFADGKAQAISQCEAYVKTAAQFLSEINSRKEAYFIQNQEELFNVCMEMAEKITLQELKTDKKVLFNILEQAAKSFRNSDYLKISFAKGDVSQEVVTDLDFIRTLVGNIPDIDVEVLSEASEGTVILDDNSEIIDASVPTQLDLLKEIMKNSQNTQSKQEG